MIHHHTGLPSSLLWVVPESKQTRGLDHLSVSFLPKRSSTLNDKIPCLLITSRTTYTLTDLIPGCVCVIELGKALINSRFTIPTLAYGNEFPFYFTLDASKVTLCGIVDSELAGEITYLISHLAFERLGILQEERDVWNHYFSLSVRK